MLTKSIWMTGTVRYSHQMTCCWFIFEVILRSVANGIVPIRRNVLYVSSNDILGNTFQRK